MYIFDAHCDYLWMKALGEDSNLENNNGKIEKSIFAVFEGGISDDELMKKQFDAFKKVKPVKKTFMAFEGLSWVKSLWDLEKIFKYNPVYVGPVWNNKNEFGGSCYNDGPLTIFGKCFLEELDNKGIFIDLAHSGEEMFASSIDSFKNVLYSHGNVFEVQTHPRNIKKHQIKKLIKRNCFMGLTLYTGFVGAKSIHKLFEHIEYVLDLGGENILGFGSDIDGCENLVGTKTGAEVFDEIMEEFLKRNYKTGLIKKILHLNLEKCIQK
ncbi:MAG: hypothetical protein E7365_01490 [Clostridiales bacterium]|nr:hypothetical protein [Clostridiales bacterium]